MNGTRILDCRSVSSEADFWDLYLGELHPDGADLFGRNLDALWDALHGGPGWPGEGGIVIRNANRLAGLRGGLFLQGLRKIARDSDAVALID